MINIVNIFLITFWFIIIPFLLGSFIENEFVIRCQLSANKMISRTFVFGFAFMLASFQIIAVPLIFIGASCNVLTNAWACVIVVFSTVSVCSYFYNRRLNARIKNKPPNAVRARKSYGLRYKFKYFFKINDKESLLIWLAALCLIIFQTSLLIFRQHTDTDDARFLAEALEAWEKNSLLRMHPITGYPLSFPVGEMQKDLISPYPLFIAVLAKLTLVHPTVLAHYVFPVLLIPLSYCSMYVLGRYFFDNKRSSGVFMLVLSVIVLFSFESVFSIGYTLLTVIWQGRSVFMTCLLPFIFYLCIQIYTEGVRNRYIYLTLFICLLACADLSGTGIILSICLCGIFVLGEFIINKKIRSALRIGIILIPNIVYLIIYHVYLNTFEFYGSRFLK